MDGGKATPQRRHVCNDQTCMDCKQPEQHCTSTFTGSLQKMQADGNKAVRNRLSTIFPLVDSLFMPTSMTNMVDSRNWFAPVPASRRRQFLASRRDGVYIHVDAQRLINFASNDYLGLSCHPAVCMGAQGASATSVGSGASRLVCGDDPMLHRLEHKLADWKGYEACLICGSGMLANMGLIQALANRHTHVFADRLNHASLVDGVRLSGAQSHRFKHLDMQQLESRLESELESSRESSRASQEQRRIIISDGVFSMDGDCADIARLIQLADSYNTLLIIDDAHGIGVMGEDGKGLTAACASNHPRMIEVGTFGKSFGAYGAFILGTNALIEGLRQQQRSMIYSTALPLAMIAAAETSLLLIQRGEQRQQLQRNITYFKHITAALPFTPSDSPIQPLIIGSDQQALDLASQLRHNGFFVPAIRPPTVPEGTARLRFTLSALHNTEHMDALAECLQQALRIIV